MTAPDRVTGQAVATEPWLHWRWFDDGAVVFDRRTGDTHALETALAVVLTSLDAAARGDVDAAESRVDPDQMAQLTSLGLL